MKTLTSLNPSTGEIVGEVSITSPAEIDEAVARARAAQPAWAALGVSGRRAAWLEIGEKILEHKSELAELLTREMGKPLREAEGEIKSCGHGMAENFDEIESALAPDTLEDKNTVSTVHYDPLGVCAVITPWNFPFSMPHWMVFPALATGNTVVLKPSEETPLTAQAYADILTSVLPAGVFEIVHGADEQGRALVAADVDLIAFTGSRSVGKKIMAAAAPSLKRIVLELGGKDPLLVLGGADVGAAAKFAARNSFRNAGQVCVSTERILVEQSIAGEFVDKLVAESAKMTVGDGFEPGTRVGPMISGAQRAHVLKQIDAAVADGAVVAFGGGRRDGNFVEPTVLTGVSNEMDIAVNETFGPVACVTTVADANEAVAVANNTRFGLGAAVFGEATEAKDAARKLTAGMIGINKSCGGASGTPWVGAQESGFGFHSSVAGHRNFTQPRVISMPK